ncbi:MAG: RIP metalloprotease RseP [Chloroflexota bacterium]|nr:RIP metalloprotease RseP [Chloroflexota bacterium]
MDFGWLSWLWIVPVLGLLVFVHELGHFVTARMNGIRVDEFGFGFPPRLFGIKRGGVMYSINAIPVGGFVRIHGENGENADDPDAFGSKKPWQRAIVLSAGSIMNVLLAVLIFAGLAMTAGLPTSRGALVSAVASQSPAAEAGLQSGDKLVSIAGTRITSQEDVAEAVQQVLGTEASLVVEREGREIPVRLTPRRDPPPGEGAIGITVAPDLVQERYGPLGALRAGVERSVSTVLLFIAGIGDLITGRVEGGGVAGPVGIAQVTSEIADRDGALVNLLTWTAFLSLNLFLVNLLPLPALDGGRLAFVLLEAIRRKKVPPQREAVVHAVGMMLLLTFLVVISFFDLRRIVEGTSMLP